MNEAKEANITYSKMIGKYVEKIIELEAENKRLREALEYIMEVNGHISHDIANIALNHPECPIRLEALKGE